MDQYDDNTPEERVVLGIGVGAVIGLVLWAGIIAGIIQLCHFIGSFF